MFKSGTLSSPLPEQARFDALTGAGSRRRFEEQLTGVWKASESCGTPFSLLVIDIDCFRGYNNEHGEAAGDECLRQVAAALKASLRDSADFLARCSGEEFAVILPVTDETIAGDVAERLRQAVMGLSLPTSKSSVASVVTISVGVATSRPDESENTPMELFEALDVLMGQAKRSGRNRVWMLADYEQQRPLQALAA